MSAATPSTTTSVPAFWWNERANFGDCLVPYLLTRLLKRELTWSDHAESRVLVSIGSVLHLAKPNWVVWGSGFGKETDTCGEELDIRCVRGPLTSERIAGLGYPSVPALGDPALLLPSVVDPIERLDRPPIGIALHYLDLGQLQLTIRIHSLLQKWFGKERFLLLHPFQDVEAFIAEIRSCSMVISSGLHPLILADAFGIPNAWFDVKGGTGIHSKFKFYDYFHSVGREAAEPDHVSGWSDLRRVLDRCESWKPISWESKPLLDAMDELPLHCLATSK